MSVDVLRDDVFTDSDTDYVAIDAIPNKKEKKVIASPRVSKQMRKNSPTETNGVELTSSRKKSPRTLKQQHVANYKSPSKSAIRSLTFPDQPQVTHIPLNEENRKNPLHVPYYLSNFECILRGVIDETDDKELFDENEIGIIKAFRSFSLDSKKLFCRLFQRKKAWLMRKNIQYDEIKDIDECLQILCDNGFLSDSSELIDLETVLDVLSAPAVKQLCKQMNIKIGSKKEDCINALMNHSKKKSFFVKSSNMTEVILKKARELIDGSVYRIKDHVTCIFMRVLSLYSLSNFWDERESERGQQTSAPQLTSILLQNTGKIVFPVFSIIRKRKIFQNRDDLLHFESVCALEGEMAEFISNKDWEGAVDPVKKAIDAFDELIKDPSREEHLRELPDFLRRFTSGSVLAYILTKGVDIFERLKNHEQAVIILRKLTGQDLYLPDYHGHWYERLVLDLDQHLKSPKECLEAVKNGLDDPYVQEARLLSLCQRLHKVTSTKKNAGILSHKEKQNFIDHKRWLTPQDPITITIQGKMMPKSNMPGEKTVFVAEGEDTDLLCSVEEFVKEHFKSKKGFTNGLHAEGSVTNTIAAILFWDIIYADIEDVFRSPQQAAPLDYNSPHFYSSRKELIEKRLSEIADWSKDQLCEFATERWESCCQVTACPANWELFTSLPHFLGLLRCFSGAQLNGLCRRLMMNHRHTRSGFPDLTMWDKINEKVAFVEVKGPNDRLSNKQILWLDYLNSLGMEAVVCHIEALNGKRINIESTSKTKNTNAKRAKVSPKKKRERKTSEDDFR